MTSTGWIILSIVCLLWAGTVVVCAYWHADRRALRSDRDRMASELEALRVRAGELEARLAEADKKLAVTQETSRGIQAQFEQAQKSLREAFKSLASDALSESSKQFLSLAKKSLEGEQKDAAHQLEQRKQAIKSLVDPLKESLDKYQTAVNEIEKSRSKAYGSLDAQLKKMVEDQNHLRDATSNLVRALRRPEVRGRWGEMQLKRVAEMSGMIENCDFCEQVSVPGDQGQLRPDMVVRMPSGRCIVVDAKTPLDSFVNAVDTDDDQERKILLERHSSQVEQQVKNLAGKEYFRGFERTPEFVVLFIPGESFLYAAVQHKPDLLESAMARGVVIATPMTLISLLKAVAAGWREEKIAENARQISDLGKELHERLCLVTGRMQKVGESIDKAGRSYDELVGSFESRVMVTARKFEQLGSASASRSLPDQIESIEVHTRPIRQVTASPTEGPA